MSGYVIQKWRRDGGNLLRVDKIKGSCEKKKYVGEVRMRTKQTKKVSGRWGWGFKHTGNLNLIQASNN